MKLLRYGPPGQEKPGLIPFVIYQNPCAHFRIPKDHECAMNTDCYLRRYFVEMPLHGLGITVW